MLKKFLAAAGLLIIGSGTVAADAQEKQPVLIYLYTRVSDHINYFKSKERILFLLQKMEAYRKQYPQYTPSVELQLSGAVAVALEVSNNLDHVADQIKAGASQGFVAVGYNGEDEPSYLRHPAPRLLNADTPELRWDARVEATEQFVNEYKDPLTGEPVRLPNLKGGIAKVQEVFGPASFVSGIVPGILGGVSAADHVLRKYDPEAVALGIPNSDPRLVIEGFGQGAKDFSQIISPLPTTAPEVYWDDGILRVSQKSLADTKAFSTDETPAMLKTELDKLARTNVRVIAMEYSAYARYLTKHSDGAVRYDPLEWAYFHPDSPYLPKSTKAFNALKDISDAYKQEDETVRWLMEDFFPANPGSRFVSAAELRKLAVSEVGSSFSQSEIEGAARYIKDYFEKRDDYPPNFVPVGNRFLSLADAFELLANSLATLDRTGSVPASIRLTPILGPATIVQTGGPAHTEVTAGAIRQAAAGIIGKIQNTEWKPVPDNAVPWNVRVGDLDLNSYQFLRLMAASYLAPDAGAKLPVRSTYARSAALTAFPTNQLSSDASSVWTFVPAPLNLTPARTASTKTH
jgi:hypothetical protein